MPTQTIQQSEAVKQPRNLTQEAEDAEAERKRSEDRTFHLLQSAFTRAEIDAAAAAYQAHLERYPQDRKYDLAHGFARTVEYQEIREADARRMGLSAAEEAEREQLFKSSHVVVNAAEDPEAIRKLEAGKDRLVAWLNRYPNDEEAARRIQGFNNDIEIDQQVHDLFFAV